MSKYYCVKCKRYHHRGKIYDKHQKFKKGNQKTPNYEDSNKSISMKDILNYDISDFRNIAKRQFKNLFKKMQESREYEMYSQEIKKLILHEKKLKA